MQWIAHLFLRIGRYLAKEPPNLLDAMPCLKTVVKGGVRMRVFHSRWQCGFGGCIVQLQVLDRDEVRQEWQEIACVWAENVGTSAALLRQAAAFLKGIRDCCPEPEDVEECTDAGGAS